MILVKTELNTRTPSVYTWLEVVSKKWDPIEILK